MFNSLQFCRAIAAMLVVLYHLGIAIASSKYFDFPSFAIPFKFGSSGVEFFFVLSGFIILTAHAKDISKPDKLFIYIKKRVFRIYPIYWIVFIGVFLMALLVPNLRDTLPNDWLVIVKSLLLLPQDKALVGGTGAPVIIVAWTLQYEMFFYFIFALLVLNKIVFFISIIIIFLSVLFFNDFYVVEFLSQPYLLLFLMGMLVSFICFNKKYNFSSPYYYLYGGVFFFVLLAINTIFDVYVLNSNKTIFYGLASSFILLGLVKCELGGELRFNNKYMHLLGDSSYALYLIHYPLISICCKIAILIGIKSLGFIGALFAFVFIFIICIFVSILVHLYLEKPIAQYIKKYAF